tara:strand:+ start:119392 stop:120258 length:867 start_codon:yes stop_codon:yes gene_type:complete
MINSMTAFARESVATEQGTLTVELRTVNHRYLDCSFKLPEALRSIEHQLREQASKVLARGKLDCMFRLQAGQQAGPELDINPKNLAQLIDALDRVAGQLNNPAPVNPLAVLQFPGVCGSTEHSEEALQKAAQKLFATALKELVKNRRREGEKLGQMVTDRLQQLDREVSGARAIMPALLLQQKERIAARIADLDIELDPTRLEQEVVYIAQKADVDEELDRLEAHVGEVTRTINKGGPCGRRLDFLMQELNREANTLSSKSISSATTQNAVELKVLIEQMREQIQNIE